MPLLIPFLPIIANNPTSTPAPEPKLRIRVSMTNEMRTWKHVRIYVLNNHSYEIQVSNNLIDWYTRDTYTLVKNYSELIPGESDIIK